MAVPTFDELFKIVGKNLWALGIPYENPKVHIRFYVSILCLVTVLVSEFYYVKSVFGSQEDILDQVTNASCLFNGTLSTIKILILFKNRTKAFQLITRLKGIYKSMSLNAHQQNEVTFTNKLITYFFYLNITVISILSFSTLFIILKIYIETKEMVFLLPFGVVMPFPMDTWLGWSVVYIFSTSCGYICIVFILTVDALFYFLTTQVCINFEELREEIEILDEETCHTLPTLIRKHQRILQLATDLEEIFTGINFYNTLFGSIEICLIGYSVSTASLADFLGFSLFLALVLTQMLMMSIFGEKLRQESLNVAQAAYFCKWYNMDMRSRKTVLILMLRAHSPEQLTGYKFSIICHETFTKIISTSWSYFTILRQVYSSDE